MATCSLQQRTQTNGQSLFEIMFAFSIAAIMLIGIVSLAAFSVRNASYSKNKALANKYTSEVSQWLKEERKKNVSGWSGFYTQATQAAIWCMSDLNWYITSPCGTSDFISSTPFKRELNVTGNSSDIVFTIKVFWTDGIGYHETVSTLILADWIP